MATNRWIAEWSNWPKEKRSKDGGKAEICRPRWQGDGLVPLRLTTTIAAAEDLLVGFSEVQLFQTNIWRSIHHLAPCPLQYTAPTTRTEVVYGTHRGIYSRSIRTKTKTTSVITAGTKNRCGSFSLGLFNYRLPCIVYKPLRLSLLQCLA